MKENFNTERYAKLYKLSMAIALIFIFVSMVISARGAGGMFSPSVPSMRRLGFEELKFSESLGKAVLADAVYFVLVVLFSSPFPVVPMLFVLARCISIGVTVGIAAKCRIMKDAAMISLGAFASNVLILPLYLLLFVMSVNYSSQVLSLNAGPGEFASEYGRFMLRAALVFALMCVAECLQMGAGVLILGHL